MPKKNENLDDVMEIDAKPEFKDEEPVEPIDEPKPADSIIGKMKKAEIDLKTAQLALRRADADLEYQKAIKWVELSTDGKDKDLGLTNDTKRGSWVQTQTIKFADDVFKKQGELIEPEAEFHDLERKERRERLEILVRLFAGKQEMNMLLDLLH